VGVQLQAPVSVRTGALRRAADPKALRRAALRSAHRLRDEPATRVAWQALWPSRLIVLVAGVVGVLSFGQAPGSASFDPARLTAPFGYLGNLLVSPFARWDSVWYLAIAHGGYDHQLARTEFFPLYPLLMRWLAVVVGTELVAGILISCLAFAVALVLLYRLAALELGGDAARACVLLLAFSPMAWAFSAVYTESLFLALSLGCILRARAGSWGWAGVLGALAAASRAEGLTLIVPFIFMFLYGPRTDRLPVMRDGIASGGAGPGRSLSRWVRHLAGRARPRFAINRELGWVLLVPAGFGAFLLGLALSGGQGLAPFHAHGLWFRHFAGPFGGIWDGAVAAWDGLRQLVHGPGPPIFFPQAGGNPLVAAEQNLVLFAALIVALIALVGVFRRLPLAYGMYGLATLALPLSYPVTPQPLQSIARYAAVIFPLFMWAGWWVAKKRITTPAVAVLAVLLGLFTAEFATWRFVG
jgi:hypothetical protein